MISILIPSEQAIIFEKDWLRGKSPAKIPTHLAPREIAL
jgi:hypothetical protein